MYEKENGKISPQSAAFIFQNLQIVFFVFCLEFLVVNQWEGQALVALCYHSGTKALTQIFKEYFCWVQKNRLAVIFFQYSKDVFPVSFDIKFSIQKTTVSFLTAALLKVIPLSLAPFRIFSLYFIFIYFNIRCLSIGCFFVLHLFCLTFVDLLNM